MRSGDGMMRELAAGNRRARWGRIALLALAFQLWSGWMLLGVWVAAAQTGSPGPLGRIRILPAHPDWVLPALAQSVVVALVVVGLAGRRRPVWGLLAAPLAGAVAWGVTFALVPNGAGDYVPFQAVIEVVTVAVVLAALAVTWRIGRWLAVPFLAAAGGAAGALRLLLTNTVYGVGWPEDWARGLVSEVVGVALLAGAVAILRTTNAGRDGTPGDGRSRSAAVLGTVGLLVLTVIHLGAGAAYAGWTAADSRRLLAAAAILALVAAWAVIASLRTPRTRSA